MNDYVSYTVIATGFDSARKSSAASTFKSHTKKPGEHLSLRGGFYFMDTSNIDKEDLDVPTIPRVKNDYQLDRSVWDASPILCLDHSDCPWITGNAGLAVCPAPSEPVLHRIRNNYAEAHIFSSRRQ